MGKLISGLTAICLSLPLLYAQGTPGLPIKRVVLYKNGVGYFEHLGKIHDNQPVTISFASGQLNDVLKTLTVLDLNGGRIKGVEYGSSGPLDRQLSDLRLPLGEKTSLTDFLTALRGARLEVKSGTNVITGRLLSVERKTRMGGGATLEVDYLSIMADSGELRTTELSPSFSVKMLEKGLPGKVDRYLDLVSAGRQPDVRQLVISTEGTGERSVFVSYISETPVWKSTYRIVLGSRASQKPLLQGWAIVDNTSSQSWEDVQLSLVAGAPQSFIQNISQPYYARRPVIGMPEAANNAPQTFESTLRTGGAQLTGRVTDPAGSDVNGARVRAYEATGAQVAETTTSGAGVYRFASLPDGVIRLEVELPGFRKAVVDGVLARTSVPGMQNVQMEVGNVSEALEVNAKETELMASSSSSVRRSAVGSGRALGGIRNFAAPPPAPRPGSGGGLGAGIVDTARLQAESAADAQELGDLFEYKLKEPITIQKNQSALVPIVQSAIVADKVSIWSERAGLRRPLRALWLNNTSGLTLDGGTFSVMEEETFAGEGILEQIRPGERRLISYAVDLALNASSRPESEPQRVTRVLISRGTMTHHSEVRERKTYTFRNEDTSPRTVIVEHPVRAGYELRSETKPMETSAGSMRFQLPVASKQTATLVVEESRPIEATYALHNINSGQIALFLSQKAIDSTIEAAFRQILAQKAVVQAIEGKKQDRESEKVKIFEDQQRLRENMKALKGGAEERSLLQRYTQQLNAQENRLEALEKELASLETEDEKASGELDSMILKLSFDVKL